MKRGSSPRAARAQARSSTSQDTQLFSLAGMFDGPHDAVTLRRAVEQAVQENRLYLVAHYQERLRSLEACSEA